MRTYRHIYEEVYYSDLDCPHTEIENALKFINSHVNTDDLYLVSIDPHTKKVFINPYNNKNNIVDYIFVRSDLAGVGNYHCIVEHPNTSFKEEIEKMLLQALEKNFFDYPWVNDAIDKDIVKSVLIVDCDGGWIDLFQY